MATSMFSIGGLISNLDTNSIVSSLIELERVPITRLETRKELEQARLTAWQSVNTKLLALKINAYSLAKESTFRVRTASSSNSSVLTASAQNNATTGSFSFTVQQLAQTHQVASRGFADKDQTTVGTGAITIEGTGGSVNRSTSLKFLNNQNGVARGSIKVSDRAGNSAAIDLSKALTITDVINTINSNETIKVIASVNDSGDGLLITDNSGSITNNLKVEEVGSGTTAADLGIKANVAAKTIIGSDIFSLTSSTSLALINDGRGFSKGAIKITDRIGNMDTIDLQSARTIQDVINLIQAGPNTNVSVQISDNTNSLKIIDNNGSPIRTLLIEEVSGGNTATSLGILTAPAGYSGSTFQGKDVIAGLDTVLLSTLNGGSGVAGITGDDFRITTTLGGTFNVDIGSAATLKDIIDAINGAIGNTGVIATLNTAGNGLKLTDTLGGTGNVSVTALGGSLAASQLGILKTGNGAILEGNDLDPQYITRNTLLSEMNDGQGVFAGKIKITDRSGASAEINLTGSNVKTIGDVLDIINTNPGINVNASINATGDGVLITDNTGSTISNLIIEEVGGGSTAADLNILGNVEASTINGSLEKTITIDSTNNTLEELVETINSSGARVTASIINDGSTINQYRLFITSKTSGLKGRMTIDTSGLSGGVNPNFSDSVKAQDSVLILGDASSASPIMVQDNDNNIDSILSGVSLQLKSVSTSPVSVTISPDTEAIKTSISQFVGYYNGVMSSISEYMSYNSETQVSGVLFSDNALSLIRLDLFDFINNQVEGLSSDYTLLSQVGINLGLDGQLAVNSTTLDSALNNNLEAVEKLFVQTNNVASKTFGSSASSSGTGNLREGYTIVNNTENGSFTYNEAEHRLDFVMDRDDGQQRYIHSLPTALSITDDFNIQFDVNFSFMSGTSSVFGIGLTNSANTNNLSANGAYTYFGVASNRASNILIDSTGGIEGSSMVTLSPNTNYRVAMSYDGATKTLRTKVYTGSDFQTQVGSEMVSTFDPGDSVTFDSIGLTNADAGDDPTQQYNGWIKNLLFNGEDFYSASSVIDGTTDSDSYGQAGGGWVSDVQNGTNQYLEVDFGQKRTISQVTIHTVDTDSMPAETYGLKSYELQYYDDGKGEWVTKETVTANTKGEITHTFSNPINTSKIRLYNPQGQDGFARVTEIEAMEHAGLAGSLNDRLGYITDAYDGQILQATDALKENITTYDTRIDYLEELLVIKEERLRSQFTQMETALGKYQSISAFLTNQIDNFSINWYKK